MNLGMVTCIAKNKKVGNDQLKEYKTRQLSTFLAGADGIRLSAIVLGDGVMKSDDSASAGGVSCGKTPKLKKTNMQ